MAKHLNIRDRVTLQVLIEDNSRITLSSVSKQLNCDPSTIYRELKNRRQVKASRTRVFLHSSDNRADCYFVHKFPYVCNGCSKFLNCSRKRFLYDAYLAQEMYDSELRQSRSHPATSKKEMMALDQKISERIKNHQSLYHIKQTDPSIELSESTLRRYINKSYLSCRTIDLPMTVRFSSSSHQYSRIKPIPVAVLNHRTYLDYQDYIKSGDHVILQLDSVIGKTQDHKCILTIYEPISRLQFGYVVNKGSRDVNRKIKALIKRLSAKRCLFFDAILTDNGSEFQLLPTIESDEETGEFFFRTFYCNPYSSYQKGGCERNHELFRYFYQKGKTLDFITQTELNKVFSHINSLKRKTLNGKSPFEVFEQLFHVDLRLLGLEVILPQKVKLKK